MRVVFMGTPKFAAVSLREMIENKFDICGVFAQPDKPAGRKKKIPVLPVKGVAQENNIPIYQPNSLKNDDVTKLLKDIAPDVIVVAAYGKILPKNILSIPKFGCINVHGSLLPKYRGAAPIQWSVINGDKNTGVTTMLMDEGLDTGDILLTEKVQINEDETSGELYDRMASVGAKLLIKTLNELEKGNIVPTRQGRGKSYAPPLDKSIAKIDFNKTAYEIKNFIRGLNPWPVAYTSIRGKLLKVYNSRVIEGIKGNPGEVISVVPFVVGCGEDTSLEFLEVQLESKKKMAANVFFRGFRLEKGTILGRS